MYRLMRSVMSEPHVCTCVPGHALSWLCGVDGTTQTHDSPHWAMPTDPRRGPARQDEVARRLGTEARRPR